MKGNLDEIHAEITELKANDREGITKTSLREIPEITDKEWAVFKNKLLSGAVQVQEMAVSPISFQLLAAPSDRAGFKFFNTLAFLVPIAAMLLAFAFSFWFVLLALGFFVMLRIAKSFYRTVIFQGVTASEAVSAFCSHEIPFACSRMASSFTERMSNKTTSRPTTRFTRRR